MSVIEYRNLLYEVSEKIAWVTESRRLLFVCKTFLRDGCENEIQDVLSLLIKLEEKNQLGIDNLEVLKDLLERMEKWNLFEMVKKFENKRKEYKSLLEQCGRVLGECSQLERLISVCEGKISHDRQGHITDVWKLFTELEKENNLGIKRLEILKTMAIEMEKPDLHQQVEEFENKREQEEDAERERKRSQVQTAAVLASARYAGRRLIGIQAQTTSALEALWKTYQDGSLQRNLQEFLVTEEIKQLVGSEVSLTVKIDEQEYKDAVCDLEAEMEGKEKWKGFEDQLSSDPVHARVREARPEVREEISQNTELNLPDRNAFVKEYLANLQETYSVTTETTDSGLGSQSAPSESGLYEDTGDIQGILERVDEGMKEISKKLDILTEPGGVAARDEDILDNIQQVRKEMKNIGKTLEMLGKPEKKTKYAARTERRELARVKELERRELELERRAIELERRAKEKERRAKEKERRAKEKALRDSSPSVPSLSSVGGGLADAKVEVEPKQQKQKEGSRVEFK